jgi:transcriptional regulator with XRE-family HTH domain
LLVGFEFGEGQIRSIGAYLRNIREKKEIALEEVAEATKIHLRFLQSIEEEEEERFPDPPYRDLFIKSYAEFLGVPLEEVMLRLPERKPKGSRERRGKMATRTKEEAEGKKREADVTVAGRKQLQLPDQLRLPIYGALLVLVVVLGYLLFGGGGEQSSVSPVVVDSSVAARPRHTDQPDNENLRDSLFLLLTADRDSWLEVRADGQSTYNAMLEAHDTALFALRDSVYVKLGNPNAVSGWLNGQPLRLPVAADSATVDFFITPNNYTGLIDSTRISE